MASSLRRANLLHRPLHRRPLHRAAARVRIASSRRQQPSPGTSMALKHQPRPPRLLPSPENASPRPGQVLLEFPSSDPCSPVPSSLLAAPSPASPCAKPPTSCSFHPRQQARRASSLTQPHRAPEAAPAGLPPPRLGQAHGTGKAMI